MRILLFTGLAATTLLASGCAVSPEGRGGQSVTHDVANYLHREWPLAGPPVIPPDAIQGGCACCGGGSHGGEAESTPGVYRDDWDQPGCLPAARGYSDDPPPAVPLEPGPPGRFFPAPVQPAFTPRGGPPTGGFGPM